MSVSTDDLEPEDEGVETECDNCGYVWVYTGKRWTTTCPNCNRKTSTPHHEDADG